MKEIKPQNSIDAIVKIPGSKSITHRALILASLARGESRLEAFLSCEDTLLTATALKIMGVELSIGEEDVNIIGTGGLFPPFTGEKEIFLGNSGTSYRLLLSVAALGSGDYLLKGIPRMHSRPIGDLVGALKDLGVDASSVEKAGYPPVLIRAKGLRGGRVKLPGNISSQYLSSLLLACPYAEKDVEIEVIGGLVSRPYVDLTLDAMRDFGIRIDHDEYRFFKIPSGNSYKACRFVIDGDVSSASYFWGAAAITGGTVKTENIHPFTTRQGDIAFLDILEEMGCTVKKNKDCVIVKGGRLKGVDLDMGKMPDMAPTLAAIALFAQGKTQIRNVSHLRHKESDRIEDTALEYRKLGAKIEGTQDGLIIKGGEKLTGTEIDPHNDHRLAMSIAMVGLKVPGVRINDEHCVDKSFPQFWKLWDRL